MACCSQHPTQSAPFDRLAALAGERQPADALPLRIDDQRPVHSRAEELAECIDGVAAGSVDVTDNGPHLRLPRRVGIACAGQLVGGGGAVLRGAARGWVTGVGSRSELIGLRGLHTIRHSRAAGERMDRVSVDLSSAESRGFDVSEYQELADLAREGLEVLRDASPERRATLMEMAAFADWLVERTRALQDEWEAHRETLRASGEPAG